MVAHHDTFEIITFKKRYAMNTKKTKPATAQNITGDDKKTGSLKTSDQETEKDGARTAIRKSPSKK